MHKAFMAEIGEEMCQAEVAHHANKCPEYFCSRTVKYVHIYKKALGISRGKQENDQDGAEDAHWSSQGEGEENPPHYPRGADTVAGGRSLIRSKRLTKMSDVELYERRTEFDFQEDAGISPHLPDTGTPEQQVADASLFDFFRLVQFHGGQTPLPILAC